MSLRRLLLPGFRVYELLYRRLHRLRAVDGFLYTQRAVYRGPSRRFGDGTRLRAGDNLGIIHINNGYWTELQSRDGSGRRAGFLFAGALVRAMEALARRLENGEEMNGVHVISGITWIRPHGEKLGFEIERLPPGPRRRLLRWHFRLLLWLRFPRLAAREGVRLEPHRFWITRSQLQRLRRPDKPRMAQRLAQYDDEERSRRGRQGLPEL